MLVHRCELSPFSWASKDQLFSSLSGVCLLLCKHHQWRYPVAHIFALVKIVVRSSVPQMYFHVMRDGLVLEQLMACGCGEPVSEVKGWGDLDLPFPRPLVKSWWFLLLKDWGLDSDIYKRYVYIYILYSIQWRVSRNKLNEQNGRKGRRGRRDDTVYEHRVSSSPSHYKQSSGPYVYSKIPSPHVIDPEIRKE